MRFAELGGPFFQVGKLGLEAGEFGKMVAPGGGQGFQMSESFGSGGGQIGESGFECARLRGVVGGEERAGEGRRCGAVSGEEARGGLARGGDAHETVGERRGDLLSLCEEFGGFQFEEMAEARGGFAERLVRGVELCELVRLTARIGVQRGAATMKLFAQNRVIDPRVGRKVEDGEGVGHLREARQVRAGCDACKPFRKMHARRFHFEQKPRAAIYACR